MIIDLLAIETVRCMLHPYTFSNTNGIQRQSAYLPLLVVTTSVRLVCHQVSSLTIGSSMLMIRWDGQGWCPTRVERIVSMRKYSAKNVLLLIMSYHAIPCGNTPNHLFPVQLKTKRSWSHFNYMHIRTFGS